MGSSWTPDMPVRDLDNRKASETVRPWVAENHSERSSRGA
jgi:hypothetical protein